MHGEPKVSKQVLARAARIKLAIFDVDGVLSDGRLCFSYDGREYKFFHAHDGYGLMRLQANGITVAIISARSSPLVTRRMTELGIADVYQGQADKQVPFRSLMHAHGLAENEVAFTGDDLPDLGVMDGVGLACSVADGHPEVIHRAHFVTTRGGGCGAVREICDLILSAQGLAKSELQQVLTDKGAPPMPGDPTGVTGAPAGLFADRPASRPVSAAGPGALAQARQDRPGGAAADGKAKQDGRRPRSAAEGRAVSDKRCSRGRFHDRSKRS